MDNAADPVTVAAYAPSRVIAGLLIGVLAVFTVLWATAGADREGGLLYGIAVVFVAAVAATDLLWRPRLRVSRAGLAVRSPTVTAEFAWPDIETVRVERRSRFGMRLATLEIDAGERLVVLSRRALNADPEDVLDVITAARNGR